jgi:hypothetical protein
MVESVSDAVRASTTGRLSAYHDNHLFNCVKMLNIDVVDSRLHFQSAGVIPIHDCVSGGSIRIRESNETIYPS